MQWCKCDKIITVYDVHIECRFVKPLWLINAQANRLTVNGIDTTNTTPISWRHTVPITIQKKEGHMVWYGTQRCVLPGMGEMAALHDIISRAISLSQWLAQCVHLTRHANTIKLIELTRMHQLWYTCDCPSRMRDGCMDCHWQLFLFTINYVGFCQSTNWQHANHTVSEERCLDYCAIASSQGAYWQLLMKHPITFTSTLSINQTKPTLFLSLSTISQHTLVWGHSTIVPTFLFGDCVVGTLSVISLTEAHKTIVNHLCNVMSCVFPSSKLWIEQCGLSCKYCSQCVYVLVQWLTILVSVFRHSFLGSSYSYYIIIF